MKTIKLFINQLFTFLNHNDMTLHLRSLFVIILFAAGVSTRKSGLAPKRQMTMPL